MTEHRFDDRRMETTMGRLLQLGVLLASAVVVAGGLLYCKRYSRGVVSYHTFASKPMDLFHPGEFLREVAAGDAVALIMLGILLLIATPIARVVFAVVAFAAERDRLYVAISLVVLAVLMLGLFHGA
jgi:uncharacterized membrane protein